jgi:hypothetical protein
MSRSYWLPIIAAIGLALAWPVEGNAVGRHGGSSANSTNTSKDSLQPTISAAVKGDVDRIAGALEAINKKPASPDEKRNADAQESVAWWTPWFLGVAFLEMLITATGVVLVYGTLRYSRRLFEDQKLATKAAQDAVETSRAQVRAYLTIDSANFNVVAVVGGEDGDKSHPIIKIMVVNSGQTPAKNFVWAPTIQYIYTDFFGPKAGANPISRERTVAFDWQSRPGKVIPAEKSVGDSLFVPEMSVSQFVAGLDEEAEHIMVRVRIEFEYLDAFNEKTHEDIYFGGLAEAGGGIWQCHLIATIKPDDWDNVRAFELKQNA